MFLKQEEGLHPLPWSLNGGVKHVVLSGFIQVQDQLAVSSNVRTADHAYTTSTH